MTSANLLVLMLLFLVCGNVALLMFARAATRENEITVRSALGATRGRITGQLFVEALVLGVIAGAVGLMAAQLTWRWVFEVIAREMWDGRDVPFWFRSNLSPVTVPYAALLTLLAAGVTGFLPGLKVTRGLATRLRQVGPGGGGLRFGGIWTVLIVAQVAVMATVPVFLFVIVGESGQIRSVDVGFPTEEYLSATLVVDQERVPSPDSPAQLLALAAAYPELERRLEAEPGVTAVTFADRLPLMSHPHRRIEVDRRPARSSDRGESSHLHGVLLDHRSHDVGRLAPVAHGDLYDSLLRRLAANARSGDSRRARCQASTRRGCNLSSAAGAGRPGYLDRIGIRERPGNVQRCPLRRDVRLCHHRNMRAGGNQARTKHAPHPAERGVASGYVATCSSSTSPDLRRGPLPAGLPVAQARDLAGRRKIAFPATLRTSC